MSHYTRFPAPKTCEFTPRAKAFRAFRAAERLARYLDRMQNTRTHSNRLEEMDWHENFWDDSCHSELGIYTGNWNEIDEYDRVRQCRETVPGGAWPRSLSNRLEKLGAEVLWSDEHSTCGACGKLIRTQCDSFSWRPDFHVGHGEITCIGCLQDSIGGESDILDGIAEILWADVWADMAEKAGESLSGCDILEVMDPVPVEATELARKVWADFLHLNRREVGLSRSCEDILEMALRADLHEDTIPDFDDYARRFGQCVAYRAMGAGVSWADDHTEPDDMVWSEMLYGASHYIDLEGIAAECLGLVWDDETISDGGDQGDWVLSDE